VCVSRDGEMWKGGPRSLEVSTREHSWHGEPSNNRPILDKQLNADGRRPPPLSSPREKLREAQGKIRLKPRPEPFHWLEEVGETQELVAASGLKSSFRPTTKKRIKRRREKYRDSWLEMLSGEEEEGTKANARRGTTGCKLRKDGH